MQNNNTRQKKDKRETGDGAASRRKCRREGRGREKKKIKDSSFSKPMPFPFHPSTILSPLLLFRNSRYGIFPSLSRLDYLSTPANCGLETMLYALEQEWGLEEPARGSNSEEQSFQLPASPVPPTKFWMASFFRLQTTTVRAICNPKRIRNNRCALAAGSCAERPQKETLCGFQSGGPRFRFCERHSDGTVTFSFLLSPPVGLFWSFLAVSASICSGLFSLRSIGSQCADCFTRRYR